MSPAKPRIAVSACLLGEAVRYDGAHKRQDDLLVHFAGQVEWLPICPEVELGLGVPRETIGIQVIDGRQRLVAHQSGRDLTERMRAWAAGKLDLLPPVDGFILKARSPSCGVGSTPAEGASGLVDGFWAAAVRERLPAVPIAQETDLSTAQARNHFLEQARLSHRTQNANGAPRRTPRHADR